MPELQTTTDIAIQTELPKTFPRLHMGWLFAYLLVSGICLLLIPYWFTLPIVITVGVGIWRTITKPENRRWWFNVPTWFILFFVIAAAWNYNFLLNWYYQHSLHDRSQVWKYFNGQALATTIGGLGAALLFYFSYVQKRDHFDNTQKRLEKEFKDTQKLQNIEFRKNALNAELVDIMNRLSSEQPFIRAGAALRLS